MSLPRPTQMFQFRRFPSCTYLIQYRIPCGGFPHSEISGSMLICSSPKLIAAYRVLHRLLMPRHSPCALFSLIISELSLSRSTKQISPNLGSLYQLNYAGSFLRSFLLAKIVFYPIKNFPFMLPSHNCIIISQCSVFKVHVKSLIPKRLNEISSSEGISVNLLYGGDQRDRTADLLTARISLFPVCA